MDKSYIKNVFGEYWDIFQVNLMKMGGNQRIIEYWKDYRVEAHVTHNKYDHFSTAYYSKRLHFWAQGETIYEHPPPRDFSEAWSQGKEKATVYAKMAEKGILAAGKFFEKGLEKTGLKDTAGNAILK